MACCRENFTFTYLPYFRICHDCYSHLFLVHLTEVRQLFGLLETFTFNDDTGGYCYRLIQGVQLNTEPRRTASLTANISSYNITYHMLEYVLVMTSFNSQTCLISKVQKHREYLF